MTKIIYVNFRDEKPAKVHVRVVDLETGEPFHLGTRQGDSRVGKWYSPENAGRQMDKRLKEYDLIRREEGERFEQE